MARSRPKPLLSLGQAMGMSDSNRIFQEATWQYQVLKDEALRLGSESAANEAPEPSALVAQPARDEQSKPGKRGADFNGSEGTSAHEDGSNLAQAAGEGDGAQDELGHGGSLSINLPLYYRYLFETATAGLGQTEIFWLLSLCFAQKRKERLVRFLDAAMDAAIDGETRARMERIKNVVVRCGRDGWREIEKEETQGEVSDGKPAGKENGVGDQHQQEPSKGASATEHAPAAHEPADRSTDDDDDDGPLYFIIPTLLLAYPSLYLTAWISNVPYNHLWPTNILTSPVAALLPLNADLASQARIHARATRPQLSDEDVAWPKNELLYEAMKRRMKKKQEEQWKGWEEMYDSLVASGQASSTGSAKGANGNENKLGNGTGKGEGLLCFPAGGAVAVPKGGYNRQDLEKWLDSWKAQRVAKAMKELGEDTRRTRPRTRAGKEAGEGNGASGEETMSDTESDSLEEGEVRKGLEGWLAGADQRAEDKEFGGEEIDGSGSEPEKERATGKAGGKNLPVTNADTALIEGLPERKGKKRVDWRDDDALVDAKQIHVRAQKKRKKSP